MKATIVAAAATLALWTLPAAAQSAAAAPPTAATDVMPRIYAVRELVADLDRAERFYREGLGVAQVRRLHENERLMQFASGIGVILVSGPPRADASASGGFILKVADIDAATARIAPAGGTVLRPPNKDQGSGVRSATVRDPDGMEIELIQFSAPK